MQNIEYSDGIASRSRKPWLLLIRGEEIHVFKGEPIPGVVAIAGSSYTKNGKWSHTTYRLGVADDVRVISGRDGWEEGTFAEGLSAVRNMKVDSWIDLAAALGVMLPSVQEWLRAWRPLAAERFDKAEAALAEVDDAAGPVGATEVAVSFGSPTNRVAAEGFWDWPVIVARDGVELGRLTKDDSQPNGYAVSGPVRVLAFVHSAGYHGGTISMRLAVPDGCTASHCKPEAASSPEPGAPAQAEPPKATSLGTFADLMKGRE